MKFKREQAWNAYRKARELLTGEREEYGDLAQHDPMPIQSHISPAAAALQNASIILRGRHRGETGSPTTRVLLSFETAIEVTPTYIDAGSEIIDQAADGTLTIDDAVGFTRGKKALRLLDTQRLP